MTTELSIKPILGDLSHPGDIGFHSAYCDIADLALQAPSALRFFRASLGAIAGGNGAYFAALHVRSAAEAFDEFWDNGVMGERFWRGPARQFLTEVLTNDAPRARLFSSRDGRFQLAALAVPLREPDGKLLGALSLLAPCTLDDIPRRLSQVQTLVDYSCQCASFMEQEPARKEEPVQASAAKALQNAAGYDSADKLAFALTNQLKTKSACDQVILGRVRNKKVEIVTISGIDEVKKRSPGVVQLQQALDEGFDHGEIVIYPPEATADLGLGQPDLRLHRQWHEGTGGGSVASFPLRRGDGIEYMVGLRREARNPFQKGEVEKYREMLDPYAGALVLLEEANRGLLRHVRDSVQAACAEMTKPGGWGPKSIAASAVAVILWFFLGSMAFEVSAPCLLEPAEVRNFAAPVDGILRESQVVAGDAVRPGQILCRFDDTDLQLEKGGLIAELARTQVDEMKHLAQGDRAGAQLMRLTRDELQAKQAIVELQILRAVLSSPFDGKVIAGDLRGRVGDHFRKGEPLFTVSAHQRWRIRIEMPQGDISEVRPGQTGDFAAFARPEERRALRVVRVTPSSTQRAGRNFFIVEAESPEPPEWARAGMEGVARIQIEARPVWWIVFRRLARALHLYDWI